jgi:NAD(P)-dependent dehydrogenase (short-subunit alcohol dehydrogenase family)
MKPKSPPITSFLSKGAFVTGAASGIGFSISKALASRGARVMMSDIDQTSLEIAKRAIDGDVESVVCDVSDMNAVASAAEKTVAAFGKIHLLFNNAGVSVTGSVGDTPIEDWRWAIDINLMGVVHGVEVFTPLIMSHGEGGHIVNTSSMAGHSAPPRGLVYAATKFAVVGLSEALRNDLKADRIGVSVLCPGWIATNFHRTELMRPSGSETGAVASKHPDVLDPVPLMAAGLSPERVAELTLNSILINRSHIFTSSDVRFLIDHRHRVLARHYDECLAEVEASN